MQYGWYTTYTMNDLKSTSSRGEHVLVNAAWASGRRSVPQPFNTVRQMGKGTAGTEVCAVVPSRRRPVQIGASDDQGSEHAV
jgi:hypothetical protein